MSTETARAQALEMRVKNFKRIGLVDIDLTSGEVVEIRGDAGQGKTSILDAIEAVASRYVSSSMVHRGADRAEIMIQLDGARIERVIPAQVEKGKRKIGTTLVTTRDGHPIKDAEAYVEAIFGRGGFRPMDFVRLGMGDGAGRTERLRQQAHLLLSSLPQQLTGPEIAARVKSLGEDIFESMCEIDLGGIDFEASAYSVCGEIESACSKRFTDANRECERAANALELTPAPERVAPKADLDTCQTRVNAALERLAGAKEREKGIGGRRARLSALRAEIERESDLPTREAVDRTLDAYTKQVDELGDEVSRLQKALHEKDRERNQAEQKRRKAEELERRVSAQESRLSDLAALESELSGEGPDENVEGLRGALEEARADAEARRLQDAHDANAAVVAEETVRAERFKALVKLFRDEIPREVLEAAHLGVDGLALHDGELYVGDVPLVQLGTSQQMVCAVRIWAGMHPKAPLVPIDGAESLGTKDRIAIAEAARELGVQMILTYVDPDAEPGPGVVVMRGGERVQETTKGTKGTR